MQTILRVYQFFDRIEQAEVRVQLANALRGIVSLRLLSRSDQPGVIPATEILACTPAIANLIRTGSLQQIQSVMEGNVQKLARCVLQQARRDPSLRRVSIDFGVRGSGQVSYIKVNGEPAIDRA